MCCHKNCLTQPNFGKPGTNVKEYCKTHAPFGYVNVVSKTCHHENCSIRPSFGKPGSKVKEYCKLHAPLGYVDVAHKTCLDENCSIHPSFGKPGSKVNEYCKSHAPSGYVNVASKTCHHENCSIQPSFGKPGTNVKEYCKSHAPPDYIDVINKKCHHENCMTHPCFGKPGYPPEYCVKHKTQTMIIYPLKHKKGEIILCNYCYAEIHYSDAYCPSCKQYRSLGKTVKRHNKELAIKDLLERNFDTDIFDHDKVVSGGCSRRRPDFLITTSRGYIILEIDEFQHNRKTYPCECEVNRMKEIYFDCGVKHLLFIRYNPDSYKTIDGQKFETQVRRRELLIKILKNAIEKRKFKHLAVMYLYYDWFTREDIEMEKIDPYG